MHPGVTDRSNFVPVEIHVRGALPTQNDRRVATCPTLVIADCFDHLGFDLTHGVVSFEHVQCSRSGDTVRLLCATSPTGQAADQFVTFSAYMDFNAFSNVSLRSCIVSIMVESNKSTKRLAVKITTMAARKIRMLVSYQRIHHDNQQRNQSVHPLHQVRSDHIPNRRNRSNRASSPACIVRGLMRSSPLVVACLPAWRKCKGRCKVFCPCIYNTWFSPLCLFHVPPCQLVAAAASVCDTNSSKVRDHTLQLPQSVLS